MTLKFLITGVVGAALVGAAAAGATSMASVPTAAAPAVTPVVFGAPLPQQPAAALPSPDQLERILTGLATPGGSKAGLVDGGVGIIEGRTAERLLATASQKGYLPLNIKVSNVRPIDNGLVAATVTASSAQLPPTTREVTFRNDGFGWKVTKESAMSLLHAAMAVV
uniref:Low molecular weight antigen MTB12 n=1 Tax=uncultured bacterium esnapd12 TaxID=1366592 RepID=S5TML7_9BACT|nr:low molecular weight antigen MTB12 precursor [uncultured bacterium esnapd12]